MGPLFRALEQRAAIIINFGPVTTRGRWNRSLSPWMFHRLTSSRCCFCRALRRRARQDVGDGGAETRQRQAGEGRVEPPPLLREATSSSRLIEREQTATGVICLTLCDDSNVNSRCTSRWITPHWRYKIRLVKHEVRNTSSLWPGCSLKKTKSLNSKRWDPREDIHCCVSES